ncbi:MAG: chromosome segregation protein SMC, partial [Elusimicrobia bacterium RIFOXYA12_FULL_57_11]
EQRRELFEEAAGVSKYKAKRDEAARKLEKVEADLTRLADSMVLLNEQITKLDNEAKKARLQKKYREELTGAEISLLLREREAFRSKSAEAAARLEPVKKDLEETRVAITSLEAEYAALSLTLTQKNEDYRLLREAATAVKFEKNNAEGRIVSNQEMLAEIAVSRASLETSGRLNAEKLLRAEPRLAELREKLGGEEGGLPALQADCDGAAAALAKVEEDMRAADGAAEALAAQMNEAYTQEVGISNNIARTGSDISHYRDTQAGLDRDITDLTAAAVSIEGRIAELKTRSAALTASLAAENEKAAAAAAQATALSSRLSEIDARQAAIREEKAWDESRLEAILAQGERDTYWVGLNSVLNAGIAGVRATLRHLISVKKEDLLAVEDALGRFLDAVVCENSAAAEEAIGYLKHIGKGRCRFLMLDRVPAGQTQAGWDAPGAARVMDKISCDPQYLPLVNGLLAGVYASGGAVRGAFWITGGVEQVASNEPYWEEEGELKAGLGRLDAENAALETEKAALLPGLEQARAAAAAAQSAAATMNVDFHKNETEISGVSSDAQVKRDRLAFAQAEKGKVEASVRDAENTLAALNESIKAAHASSEAKKAEQTVIVGRKDALHQDHARLKEDLGSRKANLDNYRQNLDALRGELARTEGDLAAIHEERSHFAGRREEYAARETRLNGEIAAARARLGELMHDLAEKEIIDRQFEDEINEMRANYGRLGENLKDSRDLTAENERTRYQIETEMATLNARAEETERRMADEWNVAPAEAAEKYGAVETDHDRVVFLRKRIENMGPVNMTAPEEYEALTQRYNFINSQVEDLNRAKADLRSAINKINDTTRENFKLTFDKVRACFKEIYSLLFNGGEADLMLTLPDNLLETGVEILAHPPGKKLVSITQLSGGEKALTALALLFSFFRVNPSPFCVMDEADAPLDEANVERFVRLIREFSSTTQFIVITHNKRTMEAADTLYGVTMEELGVSKLISVDLKRAADLATTHEAVGV